MKKIIFSFFIFSISFGSLAQLDFIAGVLYSEPLFNFNYKDYSNGTGVKFGFGYTHMGTNNMGIEAGLNWLVNKNGFRKTSLPIGEYTLSNDWYNWQCKLNGVFEYNIFKYYFGINAGRAIYHTDEYLSFTTIQEDNSSIWTETLMEKNVFQYGFQLGTYVSVSKRVSMDFGASVLKGTAPVQYINFNTFVFDGEFLDYQENKSSPFLITMSIGLRINISNLNTGDYSRVRNYYYDNEKYSNNSGRQDNSRPANKSSNSRGCSSSSNKSSSSGNSTSSNNSKGGSKPKLYKVGKTPVNYK
tara:strand:- start:614 stop:1513 length:900 start_codon:yes stop_codon:yes gene_type:complete